MGNPRLNEAKGWEVTPTNFDADSGIDLPERAREAAERRHEQAELHRRLSEEGRDIAETIRTRHEQFRDQEEGTRLETERLRDAQEGGREVAEQARDLGSAWTDRQVASVALVLPIPISGLHSLSSGQPSRSNRIIPRNTSTRRTVLPTANT